MQKNESPTSECSFDLLVDNCLHCFLRSLDPATVDVIEEKKVQLKFFNCYGNIIAKYGMGENLRHHDKGRIVMFGLFKKSDKPKIDAAEMERQEREQRKKELAEQMKQAMQAKEQSQKAPKNN